MTECKPTQFTLCNNSDCEMCFRRSFASYKGETLNGISKVSCWDYEQNRGVKPRNVFKASNKKYFFNCNVCRHSFESMIHNVTNEKCLRWCPYCSNHKLCEKKDLLVILVSHDKIINELKTNEKQIRSILNSNKVLMY